MCTEAHNRLESVRMCSLQESPTSITDSRIRMMNLKRRAMKTAAITHLDCDVVVDRRTDASLFEV